MEEVEAQLASFRLVQQTEEQKLRAQWQVRERVLWERIEGIIKIEEDKVKAKLEAERKKREEEERRRMEAEEKRRQEEERKRQEAEERRREAEQRQMEEQERNRVAAQLAAEEKERKSLGVTTAEQDWVRARTILQVRRAKILYISTQLNKVRPTAIETRSYESREGEPSAQTSLECRSTSNHSQNRSAHKRRTSDAKDSK